MRPPPDSDCHFDFDAARRPRAAAAASSGTGTGARRHPALGGRHGLPVAAGGHRRAARAGGPRGVRLQPRLCRTGGGGAGPSSRRLLLGGRRPTGSCGCPGWCRASTCCAGRSASAGTTSSPSLPSIRPFSRRLGSLERAAGQGAARLAAANAGRWTSTCSSGRSPRARRLLLLCSPHNPVGRVWSRDGARRSRRGGAAARPGHRLRRDPRGAGAGRGQAAHPSGRGRSAIVAARTITLMAPSKTFNTPGLGCSFAVISDPSLRRDVLPRHGGHRSPRQPLRLRGRPGGLREAVARGYGRCSPTCGATAIWSSVRVSSMPGLSDHPRRGHLSGLDRRPRHGPCGPGQGSSRRRAWGSRTESTSTLPGSCGSTSAAAGSCSCKRSPACARR